MRKSDVKVGMLVKVNNPNSTQVYRVKEIIPNSFSVRLEYDSGGETWSGGVIDVSVIKKI